MARALQTTIDMNAAPSIFRRVSRTSRASLAALALVGASSLAGCAAETKGAGVGASSDVDPESVKCADGPTVEGIDVSYYQGTIDWAKVKASGIAFGIARINDGTFNDPTFARNWRDMKTAGLIRGAYQFFRPNEDVTTQANVAIAAVGTLGDGDLPVTLDVEVTGSESASVIASRIKSWVDQVEAGTGKRPIIYTGKYFWQDSVASTAFAGYPLWIAAYGPTCPNIPVPWTNWKFFQYSDNGATPGVSGTGIDHDRFNGTLADLEAFANGTGSSGGTGAGTGSGSGSGGGTGGGTGAGSGSGGAPAFQCYSHTLGKEMPPHACVQSRSDSKWYECESSGWTDRYSDPALCNGEYPL